MPSDVIIMRSIRNYAVTVIEDLVLKKVKELNALEGEYGFGANQDSTRIYMCHSTKNGYKIYEALPTNPYRLFYASETALNRRLYGEPHTVP